MRVSVEFYGIPRRRAGHPQTEIELPGETATLADLLARLVERYPALAVDCLRVGAAGGQLQEHCLAQHGTAITRDSQRPLRDGDVLLLLSADAGG
ncbi:MAG: MoaD/ThiS family protein [Pirellulales bacterium]